MGDCILSVSILYPGQVRALLIGVTRATPLLLVCSPVGRLCFCFVVVV